MDLVLNAADSYVLTPYVYPAWWRATISLYVISIIGGYVLYLSLATISFYTIFDRRLMKHPQFLEDQVRLEIVYTCKSVPLMAIPTVALFTLEVRGYGKLYDNVDSYLGYVGILVSIVTFITFTDGCIYWIHRFLHHPRVYRHLHKDHHKWKIPTPYASHAFHWADGFLQSCPYHIYPFLFPLHKLLYLCLFLFVNVWTVSIHDGDYRVPGPLKPFYKWVGSPYGPSFILQLQLWTVFHPMGQNRWLFQNAQLLPWEGPIKAVEEHCAKNGIQSKRVKFSAKEE